MWVHDQTVGICELVNIRISREQTFKVRGAFKIKEESVGFLQISIKRCVRLSKPPNREPVVSPANMGLWETGDGGSQRTSGLSWILTGGAPREWPISDYMCHGIGYIQPRETDLPLVSNARGAQ